MLLQNFYKIIDSKITEKGFVYYVNLNENHEVFKGHFPDNPVVPGVCLIQIIEELLATELKKSIKLLKAGNIKFKAIVIPKSENIINFEYELNSGETANVNVKCEISDSEKTFMSFKGEFKIV
ncbi:MAG: hypothetical protein A2046_08275 [Bacteroidetes bacterium GWA2_30_7]|nr:MAG: hypothetical protein A2046_08275 [Bacteroidetes bacterium GWA2_30_7]